MVSSDTVCGNEAFKQGRFEKAVALWSFALEAHEANVAVILASRSAAYARLDCWPQALCDAEQAVQLQPDNLKALYRLGSAQYHLQHFQQCVETCKAALLIKPNARQLQTVLHQAEDILRLGFLTNRFPEVTKAISKMTVVAAQSAERNLHQQTAQEQHRQHTASSAQARRQTDTIQREQFKQWCKIDAHFDNANYCIRHGAAGATSAEYAYQVLGIDQDATIETIRCAYVRELKKAHPDKGGSAEQFCKLQAAYNRLIKAGID